MSEEMRKAQKQKQKYAKKQKSYKTLKHGIIIP